MIKLITKFSGIFIVIGFAAMSFAAQTPVGYVLEIKGTWILNSSNTLSPGEKLPAGGSIRRQSSSSDDLITIADMRGYILEPVSRNCENRNCSSAIALPHKASSNSLLDAASALADTLMGWVRTSPHRKGLRQSRSGDLIEDVVELTDDKIHLNSVLKSQGEQYLRWRVISQKTDDPGDWTKPIKLDKTAQATGFQPGLYEINLVRSNGSNFEPVAAAWILVTSPKDYEKTRATFQDVRELTNKWGDKVKPETKRLFLQAALDHLARKSVK